MKEYILSASQVVTGYRRHTITKIEKEDGQGNITRVSTTVADTSTNASGNTKIKFAYEKTRTFLNQVANVKYYEVVQKYDRYRFDLTFDLTGIPTNRVQSVKIRATITNKNNSSPLGYFAASVNSNTHYEPVTRLGSVDIGYPTTPYEQDIALDSLSATGWYCLYNDDNNDDTYAAYEELTFDTSAFKLIVVTDEEGTISAAHRTSKVRLAAGTYTAYVAGGSRPMACLIKTSGGTYVNYYALEDREKITITLADECDVWISVESDDLYKLMVVSGTEMTSAYIPYGETTSTYIKSYVAAEVEGYIPTTGANGHYEYNDLNEEGTNVPGGEDNPGVWVAPEKDEERNLLSVKQINTITADGIHTDFYLKDNNCTVNKVELLINTRCRKENGHDVPDPSGSDPSVTYYYKMIWTDIPANDATYGWTVAQATTDDIKATKITFGDEPPAADEPNIRITYTPLDHSITAAVKRDRGYIEHCSIVAKFGYFNNNRFFFSGNPSYKNTDYMSAVDDPTYFPASGWTKIGSDMTAIQGYLHYGSELAIIKEDNNQDATVYMRSAILTDENQILFPVQQGAQGVGAVSKWCLKTLKDDPLFLAKEGVYAIQGTDASQERTIPNRSFFIDKKLQPEISSECVAEVFRDYYIVCNPATGHCWVADGRYMDLPPGTNNRRHVYEWFPWDNIPATVFRATDDSLYFGTQDGRLCVFNTDWFHPRRWSDGAEFIDGSTKWHKWQPYDNGYQIKAHYVTKRDHLASLDFKKTMLNDGGVITLEPHERSSASITVTTDKGSWFVEQIQTDSDEPSVVIPIRHRFKNFDSIETRIENNEIFEGLSILGIQYRYAITTNRR